MPTSERNGIINVGEEVVVRVKNKMYVDDT
jgi:hypothetical protein